jgi:hypothetical protein
MKEQFEKIYKSKLGKIAIITGAVLISAYAVRLAWISYYKIGNKKNVDETKPDADPVLDLGGAAGQIYDAFYRADLFGWKMTEDEDMAIEVLSTIPDEYIDKLANTYAKLYNLSLKGDFIKYLSPAQYSRVANKFS